MPDEGVQSETINTEDHVPEQAEEAEDLILGKFKSPEDLAQAYKELESKLGAEESSQETEPEAEDSVESRSADDLEISRDEAEEAADEAGIDMDAIASEYAENGELSEETYAAFEETGFSRDAVDRYIAGQQALAREAGRRMAEVAGGPKALDGLLKWAGENIPEAQATRFNEAIQSGDYDGAEIALRAIRQQYEETEGAEPRLVSGSPAGAASGLAPFKSSSEVTEAMSDPKYKTDPAYRKQVADRLAKSDMF